MSEETPPRRRGRPPRGEPAESTGYRASESLRRHMDVASAFLNIKSQQEFIDTAVRHFLAHLRREDARYEIAATALDSKIEEGRGNVSALKTR